jgi:hypothetical protein
MLRLIKPSGSRSLGLTIACSHGLQLCAERRNGYRRERYRGAPLGCNDKQGGQIGAVGVQRKEIKAAEKHWWRDAAPGKMLAAGRPAARPGGMRGVMEQRAA